MLRCQERQRVRHPRRRRIRHEMRLERYIAICVKGDYLIFDVVVEFDLNVNGVGTCDRITRAMLA